MKKEEIKWHHRILVIGILLLIFVLIMVSGDETDYCEVEECNDEAYCNYFCFNGNENLKEELNGTNVPI